MRALGQRHAGNYKGGILVYMNKPWMAAIVCMVTLTALMLVGCGGGGGSNAGTRIKVSLVDAPFDAEEINIAITSVQVHSTANGWETLKTYSPALPVNLLDYSADGHGLLLVDCPLTPGAYTMVRLMIESAEVVVGGTPHEVDISNVEQTGIKCNRGFTVADGDQVALILDFNAGRSFVVTGNGTYKLHPVMTMSPVNVATKVTGTVAFQDAAQAPLPVPAGAVVDLYQTGYLGNADYLEAGAVIDPTTGAFSIGVVAPGTYDLVVSYTDALLVVHTYTQPGVVVTAPTTDLGTITFTVQ